MSTIENLLSKLYLYEAILFMCLKIVVQMSCWWFRKISWCFCFWGENRIPKMCKIWMERVVFNCFIVNVSKVFNFKTLYSIIHSSWTLKRACLPSSICSLWYNHKSFKLVLLFLSKSRCFIYCYSQKLG